MSTSQARYRHDDLEFARAVTFFDAIFAFAVTLLITTVDDFSPAAWSSFQALKDTNGPSLLAFAISFVVVVSFWRANHQEVTGFKALDGRLIILNCMVMFGVVLIPFCHRGDGQTRRPAAARRRLRRGDFRHLPHAAGGGAGRRPARSARPQDDPPGSSPGHLINAAILPLVFLGSIPLAYLVSPQAAEQSWISLAVIMPVLGWLEQARMSPRPQPSNRHSPIRKLNERPFGSPLPPRCRPSCGR